MGGKKRSLIDYHGGDDIDFETRPEMVHRIDPETTDRVREDVRLGNPLMFMPCSVYEKDEFDAESRKATKTLFMIHMFGCLPNGSKVQVTVRGIELFFDVRINDEDSEAAKRAIFDILSPSDGSGEFVPRPFRTEVVQGLPLFGFREEKVKYLRMFYRNDYSRRKAIKAIQEFRETAYDDCSSGHYNRKFARENGLTMTNWLVISGYKATARKDMRPSYMSRTVEYFLEIGPEGLKSFIDPFSSREEQSAKTKEVIEDPVLASDRLLLMTWDIETYTFSKTGEVPDKDRDDSRIFMICSTFHWKDDPVPLASVCLVDVDTLPDEGWTTVVCHSEFNIIKAFALMMRAYAPDIMVGFNDGGYDWPFVIEKAKRKNSDLLLFLYDNISAFPLVGPYGKPANDDSVYRNNFINTTKTIKVSASDYKVVNFINAPGFVWIDSRIEFIKLMPKSERTSLNFFLKVHNLEEKVDMKFTDMNRFYEDEDPAGMREVARYCVRDALSCQRLLVKRRLVSLRRDEGSISFLTISDTIYCANSLKITNILFANAPKMGLFGSSKPNKVSLSGKYPGAYVFEPVKGLHNERPITGLDFASLYPSLMMAYNLSPDKFVPTRELAEYYRSKGYSLYSIDFEYEGKTRYGWFIRHDNEKDKMGLFPTVLYELFQKRKAMKTGLTKLTKQAEHMDFLLSRSATNEICLREATVSEFSGLERNEKNEGYFEYLGKLEERLGGISTADEESFERAFRELQRNTSLEIMMMDSAQKALKVVMNTFYGATGTPVLPVFLMELAAGITMSGKRNIRYVQEIVEGHGFRVMYGDTDSVYVSCPEEVFAEVDRLYGLGKITKEEYWTQMVLITMKEVAKMRDICNAKLKEDNGTDFLNVAYEEVLFPVVLTGKKKYYGIPHVEIPNFHPKKLFVRGIDIVKQGQTGISKKIGEEIMQKSMSIDNDEEMIDIVKQAIRKTIENVDSLDISYFVQSDAYRPNKKNIAVQNFVKRIREAYEASLRYNEKLLADGKQPLEIKVKPPDPGERFQYVIVKPETDIDLRGRKISYSKFDMMEYVHVAQERNLPINVGFYLKSYVVGLCARFISYHPDFNNSALPPAEADKWSIDRATKFLKGFVEECAGKGKEKSAEARSDCRKIFTRAQAKIKERFAEIDGGGEFISAASKMFEKKCSLGECVRAQVEKEVEVLVRGLNISRFYNSISESLGIDPKTKKPALIKRILSVMNFEPRFTRRANGQQVVFISTTARYVAHLNRLEVGAMREIDALSPMADDFLAKYETTLVELVESIKGDRDDPCALGPDLRLVGGLTAARSKLKGVKFLRRLHERLVEYVGWALNNALDHIPAMSTAHVNGEAENDSKMLASISPINSVDSFV